MERYNSKEIRRCNCRVKEEYPLKGNCLLKNVIYEAKDISEGENKYYIGAAEGDWKFLFYNT